MSVNLTASINLTVSNLALSVKFIPSIFRPHSGYQPYIVCQPHSANQPYCVSTSQCQSTLLCVNLTIPINLLVCVYLTEPINLTASFDLTVPINLTVCAIRTIQSTLYMCNQRFAANNDNNNNRSIYKNNNNQTKLKYIAYSPPPHTYPPRTHTKSLLLSNTYQLHFAHNTACRSSRLRYIVNFAPCVIHHAPHGPTTV